MKSHFLGGKKICHKGLRLGDKLQVASSQFLLIEVYFESFAFAHEFLQFLSFQKQNRCINRSINSREPRKYVVSEVIVTPNKSFSSF